jgi:hypothetical protein
MVSRFFRAGLAALGCGLLALLAAAAISACSSSPPTTLPSSSPTNTATGTSSASASSSATASASASHSPSPSATHTSANSFPPVAPATGGGGTAGFQHPVLFWLGGMAILAGGAIIVYRNRVTRNR